MSDKNTVKLFNYKIRKTKINMLEVDIKSMNPTSTYYYTNLNAI